MVLSATVPTGPVPVNGPKHFGMLLSRSHLHNNAII